MKRIAVTTAIVFLTLAVLAVAWQLRTVVMLFIISLAIAATLDGPIERIVRAGPARKYAVLCVYSCVVGILLLLLGVITNPIIGETNLLIIDLEREYNELRMHISSLTGAQIDLLATLLPATEPFGEGTEAGFMTPMLRQAIGVTQNIGILLGQFGLAFVLSIYWMLDRTRFERMWLSLLAPEQRVRTRELLRRLTDTVGAYIRSELLQVVLSGALLTLGFWLIGFKYPLTAAALAALAWLIPLIGGGLALIPVLLIGWMTNPAAMALGVVYTVGVLLIMEFQIERRFTVAQRYWGVLVIFVMLALGSEFGLIGLLVAPPVAVAIQILLDAFLARPSRRRVDVSELPALREQLAAIEQRLATEPEELGTLKLENLAARLKTILAKSEATHSAPYSAARGAGSKASTERAVNTTQ